MKREEIKAQIAVEKERADFKKLIIQNPNYFGTFPDIKIGSILPMKFNTKYEELRCIGFHPERNLLEAIVYVKLPYGYKGNLCSPGSFEYVRFFADWDGDGDFTDPDEDLGIESVNVHDIPDGDQVCLDETKPLSYTVTIKIDPKRLILCTFPKLVKVRAILSWDMPPTAGNPNFPPPWGNVLDVWIQLAPAVPLLKDIIAVANLKKLGLKSSMMNLDLPISKPETLTPVELKKIYRGKDVPEHRYNLPHVLQMAEKIKQDPSLMIKYKLDPMIIEAILGEKPIPVEKPNTRYEELFCVGLNYDLDTLVATLRVKLPYGYSGNLCTNGSYEHVAFWAYVWDQIEQVCYWKHLGTSSVNVHDIPNIPPEGLQYAVYLPLDLSSFRDKCSKPKIIKIRAMLSWNVPPPNNPEYNPVWGNKVDALIQVRPGPLIKDGKQIPFISVVGGMAVSKISGNSETAIPSAIGDGYANGVNALESPFGRVTSICGHISNAPDISSGAPKLKYKVQYRKIPDPTWHDITNQFTIYISMWNGTTWSQTHKDQIAVGGYYEYEEDLIPPVQRLVDASDYSGGSVLADWHTPVPEGDGLYEVRALLYQPGAPPDPISGVPADHVPSNVVKVMIDNTAPDCGISLDAGPCKKFTPGNKITGKFSATDKHIWYYTFSVAPYAPPAGQFTHVPPEESYPALSAPGVTSGTFVLNTKNMAPCGYVIYLWVWDRAILNNHLVGNRNGASVGFCLLKQE